MFSTKFYIKVPLGTLENYNTFLYNIRQKPSMDYKFPEYYSEPENYRNDYNLSIMSRAGTSVHNSPYTWKTGTSYGVSSAGSST